MKSVGRSNKPGINKAAQAVGKSSQNILDAGALVIQRSSVEVTGKVQKYARMDARQFVPYSSREEGYFIINWRGSGIFVENVHLVSDFFFSF